MICPVQSVTDAASNKEFLLPTPEIQKPRKLKLKCTADIKAICTEQENRYSICGAYCKQEEAFG